MKKIWSWLKKAFTSTQALIRKYVQPSVTVVTNLEKFIDSPIADVITAIIPGDVDDTIKAKMRLYLPMILRELQICAACANTVDPNTIVQLVLAELAKMEPNAQAAWLKQIAAKLAVYLADGKLSWVEAIELATDIINTKNNP